MPDLGWRAPVFRLLIPFALGVLLYDRFAPPRSLAFAVLIFCLIVGWLTGSCSIRSRWKIQYVAGTMIVVGIAITGMFYASVRDIRNNPQWIGFQPALTQHWLIEFRAEADRTQKGWRIKADVLGRYDSNKTTLACGGIMIYTKDAQLASQALPGRKAWIETPLRPIINKPGSDHDFTLYCLRNKITHQTFLRSAKQIQLLGSQTGPIRHTLHRMQTAIRHILYAQLPDSSNAGLAAALMIGWKGGLDPEIKQHYTRTGTVHIIAISGLHISLVFEILWFLLYPLLYLRGGSYMRTIGALGCVWSFCILAGGEAAVLRAGIMFTAIHLGRWMQRAVTGEQALGLSMLLLLIADPDWLFDVGFQLSHAALLGILAFQSRLTGTIALQNPLLKNVWSSTCMTIAATIGTLPFTCMYFHQFPLLFLPANLIAVPLSSLTLVGLFLLMPLSGWPAAAKLVGIGVTYLLDCMNGWVTRLDRIPGMVWQW